MLPIEALDQLKDLIRIIRIIDRKHCQLTIARSKEAVEVLAKLVEEEWLRQLAIIREQS